jgi:hypothetical protein
VAYNFETGRQQNETAYTEKESVTQSSNTLMHQVQRCKIKLLDLHFHIPSAILLCYVRFANYRPRKPRQ